MNALERHDRPCFNRNNCAKSYMAAGHTGACKALLPSAERNTLTLKRCSNPLREMKTYTWKGGTLT